MSYFVNRGPIDHVYNTDPDSRSIHEVDQEFFCDIFRTFYYLGYVVCIYFEKNYPMPV